MGLIVAELPGQDLNTYSINSSGRGGSRTLNPFRAIGFEPILYTVPAHSQNVKTKTDLADTVRTGISLAQTVAQLNLLSRLLIPPPGQELHQVYTMSTPFEEGVIGKI